MTLRLRLAVQPRLLGRFLFQIDLIIKLQDVKRNWRGVNDILIHLLLLLIPTSGHPLGPTERKRAALPPVNDS